MMTTEQQQPQTTVLLVDHNYLPEAALICSLLCDKYKATALSDHHIVRVVTSQPHEFVQQPHANGNNASVGGNFSVVRDGKTNKYMHRTDNPITWRCHEQHKSHNINNHWVTHKGAPDGVFTLDELEAAICGRDTPDDGGMANFILLCTSSVEVLERLALVVQSIDNNSHTMSSSSSHLSPLMIGSIVPFRTMDWLTRRVLCGWNKKDENTTGSRNVNRFVQRPIVFSAFSSPLFFCRFIMPGIIMSVTPAATTNTVFLLVRTSSDSTLKCNKNDDNNDLVSRCSQLWYPMIKRTQLGVGTTITTIQIGGVISTEYLYRRQPSSTWISGAKCLLYHLQDMSMVVFPCMLSARLHNIQHHQEEANQKLHGITGKLILSIVVELYMLLYRCFYIQYGADCHIEDAVLHDWIMNESLLSNVVGSRLWVEFTNNSTYEIFERFKYCSKRQHGHKNISSFICQSRFIEFLIDRQTHATYDWLAATNDPHLDDHTISIKQMEERQVLLNREKDKFAATPSLRYGQEAICHGLILVLGIGQLMGMNVENELTTTLHVVLHLQNAICDKSYVQEVCSEDGSVGGLIWNDNSLLNSVTPKAFNLASLDELLTFLSHGPSSYETRSYHTGVQVQSRL